VTIIGGIPFRKVSNRGYPQFDAAWDRCCPIDVQKRRVVNPDNFFNGGIIGKQGDLSAANVQYAIPGATRMGLERVFRGGIKCKFLVRRSISKRSSTLGK
jgi:hypothetical protein